MKATVILNTEADPTVKCATFLKNQINSQGHQMVKSLRLTSTSTVTVKMMFIDLL